MNTLTYIEALGIALCLTLTVYSIPLDFILGNYGQAVGRIFIVSICWWFHWNYNGTLHVVIENIKKKIKK